MKRGADKQISKDDYDRTDEDNEDEKVGTGFVRADEAELSTRKIRALPRRSIVGSPGSTPPPSASQNLTSTPESTSKPKFAGFSGFGSPAANSSPFTFTSPLSPDSPSSTKPSTTLPPSFTPAPVSTAFPQNATTHQKFTSFVNSNIDGIPKHPLPISVTNTREEEDYNAAFEFYKSIRGLNVSFTSFLTKAVEEDPFIDLSQLLDQYVSKRRSIQNVWDKHLTGSLGNSPKNNVPLGPDPGPSVLFAAPTMTPAPPKPVAPEPAMPAPPAAFAGFSKPSSLPGPSTSSGGFTPTSEANKAPSKGFSFTLPSAPALTNPSPTGPPAPTFALGNSSTPTESSSKPPPTELKSAFTFGSPSMSTSEPSNTKSTPTFGTNSSTTSLFGGSTNIFGSSSTPKSLFGGANLDKSSTTSFFGGLSNPITSSPDKPLTTPSSAFGGFGGKPFGGFGNTGSSTSNNSASGSIGNPVGFGFGSPPRTPPAVESSSKTGFTFGSGFPASPAPGLSAINESAGAKTGEGGEEEVDHAKILSPVSVHDQEGEGEEDEETMHSVKTKVYKMNKAEGAVGWTDMGIGYLRMKKHKETGTRRLLLRNSSTGKLVINFNVHTGMKPTSNKQTVSFMGHDDQGSAVPFRLRVKTESAAQELKDALDREIEFVKGTSD